MRFNAIIALVTILAQALAAQPLNSNSFRLSNTSYDEMNPVISPDGKTMFITIANHPQNIGGKRDPGDIWYSILNPGNQWSTPMHAGMILNDRAFNGIAGFSADGNEMFLLSHYTADQSPARTQGIAIAKNYGNGWTKPENISIPSFHNRSTALSGYMSPDKAYFIFSAETYGSYGVDDLYISLKKSDGQWTEPKNLGAQINTRFQELSPSLSVDGKTLYFSSNGRKGNGSFDIYSSSRLDDSWTSWSEPVNIGVNVNTEGRELFYRDYPQFGFSIYTSTKNSDGYGDIRINPINQLFPIDSTAVLANTTVRITTTTPETTGVNQITVYGKVKDAKTGQAIQAKLKFETSPANASATTTRSSSPIVATPTQGYTVHLPAVQNYMVKIEAAGFISAMERLESKTAEWKNLEMNFVLHPIEVGTVITLKNVLFAQSKTTLLPESHDELDLVISFLQANPNVKIELAGHTDNRGVPSQNAKLSQARVDKVKGYLVSKGIDAKRVYGKGYGGSKPIASNDSEETRQLNRRVEFIIKKF